MILQASRELDKELNQFYKGEITKDKLEEKRQELYSKINENENEIMKSTGVVRKMDELGRIVVPMELRKTMNILPGDGMEIFTENNTIILRKYQPGCTFCGSMEGLVEFGGGYVCKHCIKAMSKKG